MAVGGPKRTNQDLTPSSLEGERRREPHEPRVHETRYALAMALKQIGRGDAIGARVRVQEGRGIASRVPFVR